MNDQLCSKLDEIVNLLKEDERLSRMNEINKEVLANEKLLKEKKQLDLLSSNKYSAEYRDARQHFFEHNSIKEYLLLEGEINLLLTNINSILKQLNTEKSCNK